MKITAIKVYPVWIGFRNQLLIKVETDEGLHGWGESGLSSREKAVAGAVGHYARFLVGRDPMQSGALWQEMYRSQYFEGGRVLSAAISAIDIALYDIKGKALDVPVYELLGGKQRDFVAGFITTALPGSTEESERMQALVDAGWPAVRFSAPPPTRDGVYDPRRAVGEAAELLQAARRTVGHRASLGIDFHHRLSVAEAAAFCRKMPAGTLDFLEEPIRAECPEAYEALRRMTGIPLAIGEEFSSKWAFLPYIERGITNFARIDICNVGGFTEALKVAGWAEAHYIDIMPHNPLGAVCTAASVHLCAAVPNFAWLEFRPPHADQPAYPYPDEERLFSSRLIPAKNGFEVPADPGLGVDVEEAELDNGEFRFWEAPHLHRSDGSHTNW